MKTFLTICFSFLVLCNSCDVELKTRRRAEKAFKYYGENEKLKSAEMFLKLVEKYPQSNFYSKNLFNAAYIYQELDSLQLATSLYNQLLNLDVDDNEPDSSRSLWDTRSNYKHYSLRNLGVINLKTKQYRTALNYLKRCQTEYPYLSDSIKSLKRQEIVAHQLITRCYLGLDKKDSALITILPDALVETPWNSHPAKKIALKIIKEHFNEQTVFDELVKGFDNIHTYEAFITIPFFSMEIIVVPYESVVDDMDKDYFINTALYVDLYRSVNY